MVQVLRVHLAFLMTFDKLRLYVFRVLVFSQNSCLKTFYDKSFLCINCLFWKVLLNYLEEEFSLKSSLNLALSGNLKTIFGDFCQSIQGLLEHLLYHLQPRMACYYLHNQQSTWSSISGRCHGHRSSIKVGRG